jgi:drug/metabolite transporter (DMT)-like permease
LAPLAVVASFAYTEGLWEMGFGVAVLHVVPSLTSVTGALIVAATIVFLLVYEHRPAPNPM